MRNGLKQCMGLLQSVEAARECGMRAVVVAGRKPLYEMGAADLVVRGLDELSFINLKQLFSNEEGVEGNVSTFTFLNFSCPAGWMDSEEKPFSPCGSFDIPRISHPVRNERRSSSLIIRI